MNLNSIGLRVWEISHLPFGWMWFFVSEGEKPISLISQGNIPKDPLINGWDASNFLRGKWLEITIPMHFFKLVVWGSKRNYSNSRLQKKYAIFPWVQKSSRSEHPGGIHLV